MGRPSDLAIVGDSCGLPAPVALTGRYGALNAFRSKACSEGIVDDDAGASEVSCESQAFIFGLPIRWEANSLNSRSGKLLGPLDIDCILTRHGSKLCHDKSRECQERGSICEQDVREFSMKFK